jgi:ubiquinone/menaquinone biosynthesis C-methylase UbiE
MISSDTSRVWEKWIKVTHLRCHLHFDLDGGSLVSHVRIGREAGRKTAARIVGDLPRPPSALLEVGSSVGFNCLALSERFPDASIIGIEPDGEACEVAAAMGVDFGATNARFIEGVGESLPFPDASFDWIVCHTVIEHVNDVDTCVAEMARVLRPGGSIHLDAPNYLWPWEPHLRIVMPPLCPKPLLRALARLQGAGAHVGYAGHLKMVHPAWVERCFKRHGLCWTNRVESKLRLAASGERGHIAAYGRAAKMLAFLQSIGLARLAISILLRTGLYPSILYTACKHTSD